MNNLPTPMVRPSFEDVLLQFEVERFFTIEASYLDRRQFDNWLDLLSDDLEYWMPVRSNRARGDEDREFTKIGQSAIFDDDKVTMASRVRKLATGYSWSEDPPSRTRRVLSNILVVDRPADDIVRVDVNFHVFWSRLEHDERMIAGMHENLLQRGPSGWRLLRRHIFLEHVSLHANNLSIFL